MVNEKPEANFHNLPTQWSVLQQAVAQRGNSASQQQWAKLLVYYHSAITAYIHGATRNPELAKELTQEFAVKFMEGTFRHANREKGSFRRYLKTSLSNFVRNAKDELPHLPLADPMNGPAVEPLRSSENAMDEELQRKFLDVAWAKLRTEQGTTGPPYFDALRTMADNPHLSSEELAERISKMRGEPFTGAGIRQILKRSRHKFAEFLYEQVEHSLDDPSTENVEEELAELKLLLYCKPIVDVRKHHRSVANG